MSVVFEGQGTTFTASGVTLQPKTITVPGWSKEEIGVTNLSNSNVKTFVLGQLKEFGSLVLNLEFDASVYADIPEDNQEWQISFPDSTGSITYWGEVQEVGDVELTTDEQPVFDLTIKVTNLNDDNDETVPVYVS